MHLDCNDELVTNQDHVDDTANRAPHGYLDMRTPSWAQAGEECLDDRCLVAITDRWTGSREQSNRHVQSEHLCDRRQHREACLPRTTLDGRQVRRIDAGRLRDGPQRESRVQAMPTKVGSEATSKVARSAARRGPQIPAASRIRHPRRRPHGPYVALIRASSARVLWLESRRFRGCGRESHGSRAIRGLSAHEWRLKSPRSAPERRFVDCGPTWEVSPTIRPGGAEAPPETGDPGRGTRVSERIRTDRLGGGRAHPPFVMKPIFRHRPRWARWSGQDEACARATRPP